MATNGYKNLRDYRHFSLFISAREMAKAIGTTYQTVCLVERGGIRYPQNIMRWVSAYKLTPEEFFLLLRGGCDHEIADAGGAPAGALPVAGGSGAAGGVQPGVRLEDRVGPIAGAAVDEGLARAAARYAAGRGRRGAADKRVGGGGSTGGGAGGV